MGCVGLLIRFKSHGVRYMIIPVNIWMPKAIEKYVAV